MSLEKIRIKGWYIYIYLSVTGWGGYLNTSVVHKRDQRFSKHTLIEVCPFEGKKTSLNKNFAWLQWCSHWGGHGGRVPPLTAKNLPKIGKKRKKSGKKGKKSGRKGKNPEGSFTLPLLTDRAGYTTAWLHTQFYSLNKIFLGEHVL